MAIIARFENLTMSDVGSVGGKNASLGELIHSLSGKGIQVPGGFAITVDAFHDFLSHNAIAKLLHTYIDELDVNSLNNLADVGSKCRQLVMESDLSPKVKEAIASAWQELRTREGESISVAVRSSATAEDSPSMSFAGQHDSFLNVTSLEGLYLAVRKCYASLFNDRAIKYRLDHQLTTSQVALSVGVQVMVRSDKGSAGVAFTIDPESGNNQLIYVTGAWGLGESVVQGAVTTDEFYFFKEGIRQGKNALVWRRLASKEKMIVYSSDQTATEMIDTPMSLRDQYVLDHDDLKTLASWCLAIEDHYKLPMDIEWAKDGSNGKLYIVQARPETIHTAGRKIILKEYALSTKSQPVLTGRAVGRGIVSGKVTIVRSLADREKVKDGDILVADITNPDWNALLRKAICIVTNQGGRTSHASIIARELGIPAVVGTLHATNVLKDGQVVTVSCASGEEGRIYDGKLDWVESEIEAQGEPTHTQPMLILADPEKATTLSMYPNAGVGLFRMEFAISNYIQVHPMALARFSELPHGSERDQVAALTRHYADKKEFFIDKLSSAIGLVASAFYPKDVIVRMSDFKTNEYAKLIGGRFFEPNEENPMLGFRGASRYYNSRYKDGFALECAAVRRVRETYGLSNVKVMIPFCRTLKEANLVLETMKEFGLERGKDGLEVYVMAEIPSNILLASDFAELFDGFSIGSNDLTQLTLGVDRDSAIVSDLFTEDNEAVTGLIRHLVVTAHEKGVKVGLCGQAPSDQPEFARFLVNCGIDSISFNADALIRGIQNIQAAEKERVVFA